jgi:hypothetical protein
LLTVCFFLVCALGLGAEPYASVSFAEGSSFTVIRNNKPASWSVSDGKFFGMELMPGDIIQTANATFVEVVIRPIGATIQIAENTSFRCDADSTGKKSSGELYYGRVRAKVKKLAMGSSYRIASPSLVAGVRGTDFGVDAVSAPKADSAVASTASPVINRVFCFDGNVIVTGAGDAVSGSVSIGGNEMVEKAAGDIGLPAKARVSDEITTFWSGHPVSPAAAQMLAASSARNENGLTVIDRPWPAGQIRVDDGRNLRIPNAMAASLIGVGAVACSVFSAISASSGVSPIETPYYTAGLVMIGSGSVLAVVSMLFERPLPVSDESPAK